MEHALTESSGIPPEDIKFGMKLLSFVILLGLVFFILETCCYSAIFYLIFNHNTLNRANLPMKEINKRKHKNVVTLSGQLVSFIVESLVAITIQLMFRFSNEEKIVETSFFPIYVSIGTTAVSMSYYFSSHELKSYYNFSKFSVIPKLKSIIKA